jgi:uncharacterized protein YdgA (DUF945 family)
MARKFFTIGLLIAFLLFSIPYLVGMYSKIMIEDEIEELQKSIGNSALINISLISYTNRWMDSTAILQVSLTGSAIDALIQSTVTKAPDDPNLLNKFQNKKINLRIHETIQHGPLVKDQGKWRFVRTISTGKLQLSESAQKLLVDTIGIKELLTTKTIVEFDGSIDWSFILHPFSLPGDESLGVTAFKGLNGKMHLNRDYNDVNMHWDLPGCDVVTEAGEISLDNFLYQANMKKTHNLLWVGKANLSLDGLKIDVVNNPTFTLNDLKLSGSSSIPDSLYQASGSGRLENINFNDIDFGPFYYSGSLKNLQILPLLEIEKKLKTLDKQGFSDEILQELFVIMPGILRNNPEINMDNLFFRTPDGDFMATLNIGFDYPENKLKFDPLLMLAYTSSDLHTVFSEKMLKSFLENIWQQINSGNPNLGKISEYEIKAELRSFVEKFINTAEQLFWIVRDGTNLKTDVELKNEQLQINGKLVDVPRLQQQIMAIRQQGIVQAPSEPAPVTTTPIQPLPLIEPPKAP